MDKEVKLCPFRKDTIYQAGRNAGTGYPMEWEATEEFKACMGEKCLAYQKFATKEGGYCGLIK